MNSSKVYFEGDKTQRATVKFSGKAGTEPMIEEMTLTLRRQLENRRDAIKSPRRQGGSEQRIYQQNFC